MERLSAVPSSESLESRILRTLSIADRWGYGLRIDDLARMLYGGADDADRVREAAALSSEVSEIAGFYVCRGRADLAYKSAHRATSNGTLHRRYEEIAEAFAADLLRYAPFIRSVCVSGSLASGGLGRGDDIDFNVVTSPGTKYLVYLVGLGLGVRYSLRWGSLIHGHGLRSRFAKVTCMNVVWEENLTRPFDRRDEFLAFELLRARALAGSTHWSGVLRENAWVRNHFPQLLETPQVDHVPRPLPSALGEVLAGVVRRPWSRRLVNALAKWITHIPYAIVQFAQRRNPAAAERQKFLRDVKFPYEFFQD